jgi:hypothetical protein
VLNFILQHPIVILYLAAAWFVAAVISAMPPYNGNNFWVRWLVNVLQIVGASLDKVMTASKQTNAFQQVKSTLQTTDADGLTKLATAESTTQIPTLLPKP